MLFPDIKTIWGLYLKSALALAKFKIFLYVHLLVKLSLKRLLSFVVPSHCTFRFQTNLWQVSFVIPLKCFASVYRPCTIHRVFSSAKLLITSLISCDHCQHLKPHFPKHTASLPAVPQSLSFYLGVAMATEVATFCKWFFAHNSSCFCVPLQVCCFRGTKQH